MSAALPFAIAVVLTISSLWAAQSAPTAWILPVTIKAMRDVEMRNRQEPDGSERRGRVYGSFLQPLVMKKGETLQMVEVGLEGGCRIRFKKREYDLTSCPWLDGFRDHQADIFKVDAKK